MPGCPLPIRRWPSPEQLTPLLPVPPHGVTVGLTYVHCPGDPAPPLPAPLSFFLNLLHAGVQDRETQESKGREGVKHHGNFSFWPHLSQAQKGQVIKVKSPPREEFEQKDLQILLKHLTNMAVTFHPLGEGMSQSPSPGIPSGQKGGHWSKHSCVQTQGDTDWLFTYCSPLFINGLFHSSFRSTTWQTPFSVQISGTFHFIQWCATQHVSI